MPTTPTPLWLKKQNLTADLFDIVQPRIAFGFLDKNLGMIRAISKEVIQVGYRRVESSNAKDDYMALQAELYDLIKPRVSVWVQTNHDHNLQAMLHEVVQVGYRRTIKADDDD